MVCHMHVRKISGGHDIIRKGNIHEILSATACMVFETINFTFVSRYNSLT